MLAFAVGDDRRKQHQPRALGQGKHLVNHLANGLCLQVGVVIGATRDAGARVEQTQVVMYFGDCTDGRPRVVRSRSLFYRNCRRQSVNVIDVGFFHHRQELTRVSRQ